MYRILLFTFLATAHCHVFRLGSCPEVEVQKDFDPNKFLGRWYVVQRFRTESSCVTEDVTKDANGTYYVTEHMQPIGGTVINQKGRLSFVDTEHRSIMKVDYPMSRPLGAQNYWVVMTDYENYAAVWTCQRLPVGHRQSAEILSRTPSLGREYVRKVRRRFEEFGVNEHYFSVVDQKNCKNSTEKIDRVDHASRSSNSSFAVKVGPFTFSANE